MLLPNREAKKHKVRSAMISVGVHVFLLGVFVMAYGVDKVRDEVPRLIKLKLGSSFSSGGLSFGGTTAEQKRYAQDLAIDYREGMKPQEDFIDESLGLPQDAIAQQDQNKLIEVKKIEPEPQETVAERVVADLKNAPKDELKNDLSTPEKIEKKVKEIQSQQVKREKGKKKGELSELETASGGSQAGSPIGNSQEGKTSLSYLELLQYTLQENSAIPHQARVMGLEGDAVLRLTFNRSGYVQEYELISKTGHDLLDDAAIKLAQKLMQKPLPAMPKNFEKGNQTATYDFPISFRP